MEAASKPRIRQVLYLGRALRLVWESGPRWTLLSVALLIVQGLLPLATLYLMKLLVDAVAEGLAAPDRAPVLARVTGLVALSGAATLLSALSRAAAGWVSEAQSLAVTDYVKQIIHAKSVAVDLAYYEDSRYYDTLHRAQQEAPYRPTRILQGLIATAQNGLSLATMIGLLFALHPGVALVLLLTALPAMFVRLRHSRGLYRWYRERTSAERRVWYFDWMLTRDSHAKEVRLFDLGELFQRRYRDLRRQLRDEQLRLSRRRSLAELAAQAVATLGVFGAYAFVAARVVNGVDSLGDLVVYYQAFQRGQGFLRDVLGGLAGLYEDSLFLSNLYEFLDLECKVQDPPDPRPVPRPMRAGFALRDVAFRYPSSTRNVLEGINLSIRPGEVIALVGENGSGKTTLVKLLCRLYDPTEGSITLDGVDLRCYRVADLRREISVIFQDYARYNLTAKENIWFGNVTLPPQGEHIVRAAQHAGAHPLIERLPRGYETVLGRWFEEGEELSAGEWQKVALARAFLRDAQLIILDEPTSALDAKTEYEVFTRFRQLIEGRAAILISHRFSTVRMADTIYVLEGGRITEQGSHEELMRLGGTYAHMFELQARPYR